MTLGRQLASAISAIFFLALIGVEAIHLRGAQAHLQRQLESVAQDAATSIGLSLGTVLKAQDATLAETVINPVFDRGHYARILYVAGGGQVLVSKILTSDQGDYPGWFAALFQLEPPTAESLVSSGWRQLGRVRVTVHPRFAYEQLWDTARNTMIYLLLIYVAALGALRFYLRSLLRPLAAVEDAAQKISARNFVTVGLRPRTRELARVVDAMNALSRKVNEAIEGESRRAEQMQAAAYRDEVTGLINARGFAARFESIYADDQHPFTGTLCLLEIADLAAINKEVGPARCDELLRSISIPIRDQAFAAGGFAGRWAGAVIAIVLPQVSGRVGQERLAAFRAGAGFVLREFGLQRHERIHCGGVEASGSLGGLRALASVAEEALKQARESAEGVSVLSAATPLAAAGLESELVAIVREALAARRLSLVGQVAYRMSDHRPLHTELFARLRDASGREVAAAQFMPIVAAHGLGEELDRAVLEIVLRALAAREEAVSINVSIRSIERPEFVAWVAEQLTRERPLAPRIVFELAEHGVVRNEAAAKAFAESVKRAGAGFGIDHFGVHRDSLALFQRLKPDYIKLAAGHTQAIVTDSGARFFAESLVRAARQLEIPVIVQAIEDDATFQAIGSLGFSGYQGILAGRPAPWPPMRP